MPILNYTTSVSAEKTVAQITKILAAAGARRIMTEYDERQLAIGIAFQIETPMGLQGFRLPAHVDAVWKVLRRQRDRGMIRSDRFVTREHAAAVGWRVIKDWIEAQLALIETEMVSISEIMLPYMTTASGQTVYQAFETGRLALGSGEFTG